MKDSLGNNIKLGDHVTIDIKHSGIVVANIDDSEYSSEYPKNQWSYLGFGVIINTSFAGLVHYTQESSLDENIVICKSANQVL